MIKARVFVIGLLIAISAASGTEILTLVVPNGTAVVSTRDGLYHQARNPSGSTTKPIWSSMPLPPNSRPGGCLSPGRAGTNAVYYSTPYEPVSSKTCAPGFGLWQTDDFGNSWLLIENAHRFSYLVTFPNGIMYALGSPLPKPEDTDQIGLDRTKLLSSPDQGRTWRVSLKTPRFITFSINPCVTNPAHVCGGGYDGLRGYSFEYTPESDSWSVERGFTAQTVEQYFRSGLSTSTSPCCYELAATLENYFDHPFGNYYRLPGIWLTPESESYHFRIGQAVKVPVRIELRTGVKGLATGLLLPDIDATQDCWGAKYIDPEGIRKHTGPEFGKPPSMAGSTVHSLAVGQPYRRELNLDGLLAFDKVGTYQVQLHFDNSAVIKQTKSEWTGSFSGQRFTVVIEP